MLLPLGDDLERPYFPIATVVLIFVNVAIFALTYRADLTMEAIDWSQSNKEIEAQFGELEEFYTVWGSVPKRMCEGEVMGLITHMFLHADIFHLIGNMLILFVFGKSLETALGTMAFVVMYLFWGLVACLSQCSVDLASEFYLIGASGAIAGVIGGYIVMFGYSARIKMLFLLGVFPIRFSVPAIVFGGFWMFQQMYNVSVDVDGALSGVAWMAHIGGFGIGAVTMLIFRNHTDRVLVRHDDRLTFASREELLEQEHESERRASFDAGAVGEAVDLKPRPCEGCGTTLTRDHLMGERLLKCPNKSCAKLVYLTDAELEPAVA